jgi:hypothetical protein
VAEDDDLDQVPWWDAEALRMVSAFERSILRLRLDSQGEFVAIVNAIEVQLESMETVAAVARLLIESLRTLVAARVDDERHRRSLDQRLVALLKRVSPPSGSTR